MPSISPWRALRPLPAALILLANLLAPANAVSLLDPKALPSCGMSCALLNQANDACVATPASQQTYDTCFCQSAYLSSLYSSPSGICDTECAGNTQDLDQIQSWYINFCQGYGAPAVTSSAASTLTATSSVAPTASSTSSGTAAATSSSGDSGSWVSDHWQWIIFLVVIVIAIVLLSLLLLWLKKRHARRRDARISMVAGPGAHQSPNDTRDFAAQPQMTTMSGANDSEHSVVPVPPPTKTRTRTSSLRRSNHSFSASKDSVVPGAIGSVGRSRSGSRPGSGFQAPAPVWGPHQNQHRSKGYGYDDPNVEVPTPVSRPQSGSWNSRGSWGPQSSPYVIGNDTRGHDRDALREEDEETEERPHTASGPVTNIAEGVRRKLSKRRV